MGSENPIQLESLQPYAFEATEALRGRSSLTPTQCKALETAALAVVRSALLGNGSRVSDLHLCFPASGDREKGDIVEDYQKIFELGRKELIEAGLSAQSTSVMLKRVCLGTIRGFAARNCSKRSLSCSSPPFYTDAGQPRALSRRLDYDAS